jgi:hypothetical protein
MPPMLSHRPIPNYEHRLKWRRRTLIALAIAFAVSIESDNEYDTDEDEAVMLAAYAHHQYMKYKDQDTGPRGTYDAPKAYDFFCLLMDPHGFSDREFKRWIRCVVIPRQSA